MSATPENAVPAKRPGGSAYMIVVMTVVATVCGLLLVGVYQATYAAIKQNLATIMRDSVSRVLPTAKKQVIFGVQPSGALEILPNLDSPLPKLFAGYDAQGQLVGIVIEAAAQGYGGTVRALYSYSPERQCITGFKVIESKETPGLGDKIDRDPEFQKNFEALEVPLDAEGQHVTNPVVAVKHGTKSQPWQIDAISGATISSRAVAKMLNKSTEEILPIITRNLDQIRNGGA